MYVLCTGQPHLRKQNDHLYVLCGFAPFLLSRCAQISYIFWYIQFQTICGIIHPLLEHILDVVIIKNNQNKVHYTIVGDVITDHNIIVCKVFHPKPKPIGVVVITRKCCGVDTSAVKSDISARLSVDGDLPSAFDLINIYNEALAFNFG